jgi:hypothetical protein
VPSRPGVIVFDLNETLSDMAPLARCFAELGLIGAGHARIRTLLDELDAELNGTGSSGQADRLSGAWRVLATLLESHVAWPST